MTITFLYHSGVLIETETHQIFIDAIERVSAHIDITKQVYFLVSHGHADHFDRSIFNYSYSNVHFVLSDDIAPILKKNHIFICPNQQYNFGDFTLDTYDSTDSGVSFVIYIKENVILHSGDLNWWHWQNDDEATQKSEENQFKTIVEGLPSHIDVAFIPLDPRLGDAAHYAIDHYLNTKSIAHIIPIHFRDNYDICQIFDQKYHNDTRLIKVNQQDEKLLEL